MLLSIQKPDADRLQTFLEEHGDAPFSYPEVGQSLDGSPAGYDVDFHEIRLGEGREVFEKAAAALKNWQQFPAGWCFIGPGEPPVEVGQVVVMSARVLGVWFSNLAKIVFLLEEENRSGFAYGTLDAHVERGEEVFLVEQRGDGSVWYVIRAFSKPRFWAARLNYPFARDLQKSFVRDSQAAMLRATVVSSVENQVDLTSSKPTSWQSGWLLGMVGLLAWLALAVMLSTNFLDGNWPVLILVFAASFCSPMAFELAGRTLGPSVVGRWLRGLQLVVAYFAIAFFAIRVCPITHATLNILYAGSIYLSIGAVVVWVSCTFISAGWGLWFLLFKKRPGSFSEKLPLTTIAFGLVFLAVGGAWLTAAASGFRPMGFDPVIVLLTAIHFHFAGLVLPILTGLAAEKLPGPLARAACLGVLTGVPLTAMGITASQFGQGPFLEILAASWMATAGMLVAVLHGKLAVLAKHQPEKTLFALCAASLAGGMVLAFLYGIRSVCPVAGLDIPWMRALHGTLNSLGFAGLGLAGWMHFARRSR